MEELRDILLTSRMKDVDHCNWGCYKIKTGRNNNKIIFDSWVGAMYHDVYDTFIIYGFYRFSVMV